MSKGLSLRNLALEPSYPNYINENGGLRQECILQKKKKERKKEYSSGKREVIKTYQLQYV